MLRRLKFQDPAIRPLKQENSKQTNGRIDRRTDFYTNACLVDGYVKE